jgi:hypothetical protein
MVVSSFVDATTDKAKENHTQKQQKQRQCRPVRMVVVSSSAKQPSCSSRGVLVVVCKYVLSGGGGDEGFFCRFSRTSQYISRF